MSFAPDPAWPSIVELATELWDSPTKNAAPAPTSASA
jgi:hypothetical protein